VGDIYKLSCECGYETQLNIGGGLLSSNIRTVNKIFSEEQLKEFNKYYINGEVTSFFVKNEVCLCNNCKEIMSIPVLKFQLSNNKKFQIANICSNCSNNIQISKDTLKCPKCSKVLLKQKIGLWD
jgi:DNA-directed RNA polymerase subunit RPC12/RpoP